jgi:putative serine protease PepD
MRSSIFAVVAFASLLTMASSGRGTASGSPTTTTAMRAAVVQVEAAVDLLSPGPELAAELNTRERLTPYQTEIARRLRMGSTGTGFLVNPRGDVVTTAHVVLSGVRYRGLQFTHAQWDSMAVLLTAIRDIWVTVGQGDEERSYLAVPVAVAEELDLAVLRICLPPDDRTDFTPLPIGRSDALRVGDYVLSLGFPEDEFGASPGEVISLIQGAQVHEEMQIVRRRDPETGREVVSVSGTSPGPVVRFQHSAPTGHGSSGGPLLDRGGRVIGVAYALLSSRRPEADGELAAPGLNLAITSDVLKRFLVTNAVPFDEAAR